MGEHGLEFRGGLGGILRKQIEQLDRQIELLLVGVRLLFLHDLAAAEEIRLVVEIEGSRFLAAADDRAVDDDLLSRAKRKLERHLDFLPLTSIWNGSADLPIRTFRDLWEEAGGGGLRRRPTLSDPSGLEQPQDGLLRLVGQRQRDGAELLTSLQRQDVRTLFVLVGQRQLAGAFLQDVRERRREVEAGQQRVAVGAERRRRGPQLQLRGVQLADRIVDIRAIVPEVLGEVELQALTVRLDVLADNRHRAGVGLVQLHSQVVGIAAVNQLLSLQSGRFTSVGATHIERGVTLGRELATDLEPDRRIERVTGGQARRRQGEADGRAVIVAAADREARASGGQEVDRRRRGAAQTIRQNDRRGGGGAGHRDGHVRDGVVEEARGGADSERGRGDARNRFRGIDLGGSRRRRRR